MYLPTAFVASLLLISSVIASPHNAMNRRNHAALVKARAPVIEALVDRQLTKRCKPRNASISKVHSSTQAPAQTPVGNAASDPSPTSEPSKPTATPKPPPPPPPPPKPTEKPAPAPPPGNDLFHGTQDGGQGTFYGIGLGACGITNSGDDRIVAVDHRLFDSYPGYNGANPNNNPICGKRIKAHYQGKSTVVTVTDRCGGCVNDRCLDFSPAAFSDLADFGVGRLFGMTWEWLDEP